MVGESRLALSKMVKHTKRLKKIKLKK